MLKSILQLINQNEVKLIPIQKTKYANLRAEETAETRRIVTTFTLLQLVTALVGMENVPKEFNVKKDISLECVSNGKVQENAQEM